MASKDPRVDQYIDRSAAFAKPILTRLRKAVHAGCPDVEEAIKWSFPHFMYKGMLCSMASFKEHCAFGFWKGSLLELGRATSTDGMGQFGRITTLADLPGERALVALVRKAAALNDDGVKVPRARKAAPRAAPKPPVDVMKALRANPQARAAFAKLSPSHKREYLEWITEAKTAATRRRRLETAIEWMAAGKSRNWKYERKG